MSWGAGCCGRREAAACYSELGMSVQLLRLACLAVLCIILSLGLWPFHAPRNDVRWAQDRAGLQFGRYATAISDGEFQPVSQEKQAAVSIEIWLRPRRIWDYGTFLSFQMPKGLASFAMYQSQTDLRLDANQDGRYRSSKTSLFVDDLFLKFEPAFLTVTCGPPGTSVYVNDILVKAAPQFRMDPTAVAGRMILGDAPGQSDSWKGEFLGLAIYRQELTAAQVRQHYQDWIARGRP